MGSITLGISEDSGFQMNDGHAVPIEQICKKSLVEATTGAILGILVSCLLVFTSEVAPIRSWQAWGEDLGMRILAEPALSPISTILKTDVPFVLLDVDRDTCERFVALVETASGCRQVSKPPTELLRSLIEAVSADGATAIILDFPLPDADELAHQNRADDAKAFLTYLMTSDGPPIIAPARLRATARQGTLRWDDPSSPIVLTAGRLRLATFTVWSDEVAGDGVVRAVPSIVEIDTGQPGEPIFYLPSAAFLAASLARSEGGLGSVDAVFYPKGPIGDCEAILKDAWGVVGRYVPELADACEGTRVLPNSASEPERVMFSIFSTSMPADWEVRREKTWEAIQRLKAAYAGAGTIDGGMLYRNYQTRDLMVDDRSQPFRRIPDDIGVSGQIVVIGTTDWEANDRHATPLGQMPGPELIINAARAFADFGPLSHQKTLMEKLLGELTIVAITVMALWPFIWGSNYIQARQYLGGLFRPLSYVDHLVAEIVFLTGVGFATLAVLIFIYTSLALSSTIAPADFLLPVLAVAFAGILELVMKFLRLVERPIRAAFRYHPPE